MNTTIKLEDWMKQNYAHNELADICKYGCSAGWPGLLEYSEINDLYTNHKKDIWKILAEFAGSSGQSSVAQLLAQSDCCDSDHLETYLVWFAAELCAWRLTHGEYKDDKSLDNNLWLDDLKQFKGSEKRYFCALMPSFIYTEGIQYLAENGNAHWLINLIATELLPAAQSQTSDWFYAVSVSVTKKRKTTVSISNGDDGKPIAEEVIFHTNFPCVENFTLFLAQSGTKAESMFCLMLPSEY